MILLTLVREGVELAVGDTPATWFSPEVFDWRFYCCPDDLLAVNISQYRIRRGLALYQRMSRYQLFTC